MAKTLEYQEHNIPANTRRILPIEHTFDPKKVEFYIPEPFEFVDFCDSIEESDLVSIDIETTGFDPFTCEITLIGISKDGEKVFMLEKGFFDEHPICRDAFISILKDARIRKTFHNAKFDLKFLALIDPKFRNRLRAGEDFASLFLEFGFTPQNCECSYVMRRMLVMGLENSVSSLAACSFDYLGYEMSKDERENFVGNTTITTEMMQYCALDVASTWHIWPILNKYLEIEQLTQCYSIIEKPCIFPVAKMELQGIHIDVPYLRDILQPKFEEKIAELQGNLDAYLKVLKVMPKKERKVRPDESKFIEKGWTHVVDYIPSLNVKSSPQCLEVLNKIGYEVKSTGKEILEQPTYCDASIERAIAIFNRNDVKTRDSVLKVGGEICEMILELRKCRTAMGNFITKLQSDFTNPATGKIHGSFNQMGAVTGRFSHSDPNLAQMPKPNERGVFGKTPLRRAFLPPPGCKFIVFDYAACELRILAEYTKDETLMHSVTLPDPHAVNAAKMYEKDGVTLEQVSKGGILEELRDFAKNGIYLFCYGGTERRLSATIKRSVEIARGILDALGGAMPGLPEWQEGVQNCALTRGYTRTMSGRKRYYRLPDMAEVGWRKYKAVEGAIRRAAGNAPIQGTNADITKLGMVWTDERITPLGGIIVLQVHDELVAVAPVETADECARLMESAMLDAERQFLQTVESKVEGGVSDFWAH